MVLLRRLSTLELVLDTPKGTTSHPLPPSANPPPGRGVFATALIPAGTLIDTAPIILLPPNDFTTHITHTTLLHYS